MGGGGILLLFGLNATGIDSNEQNIITIFYGYKSIHKRIFLQFIYIIFLSIDYQKSLYGCEGF